MRYKAIIMVLEQVFKLSWIERRPNHAFALGMIYSFVGILTAKMIFPGTPALMTVAFTSLLLLPSLNRLLAIEENVEIREKKFHIKQLFKDHKDIFEIYFFLFLGIMVVFSMFALFMPAQSSMNTLFTSQLEATSVIMPQNVNGDGSINYYMVQDFIDPKPRRFSSSWSGFFDTLENNIWVFVACIILSLVYGAGSMVFLTWNASAWGVFWGFMAKNGSIFVSFSIFAKTISAIFPHMILEALSYFFVIIAGGVVSKAIIRERVGSQKFNHVFTDGMIFVGIGLALLLIGAYVEEFIFPYIHNWIFSL